MKFSPVREDIVALLLLVLEAQDDLFEFFLVDVLVTFVVDGDLKVVLVDFVFGFILFWYHKLTFIIYQR